MAADLLEDLAKKSSKLGLAHFARGHRELAVPDAAEAVDGGFHGSDLGEAPAVVGNGVNQECFLSADG